MACMRRSEDSCQESFLNWGGVHSGSSLAPPHVIQAGRPVSFQTALPVSAFLALWEFWHYRRTPLYLAFSAGCQGCLASTFACQTSAFSFLRSELVSWPVTPHPVERPFPKLDKNRISSLSQPLAWMPTEHGRGGTVFKSLSTRNLPGESYEAAVSGRCSQIRIGVRSLGRL